MRGAPTVLAGFAVAAAAAALYAPTLRFELAGDDYQWAQHAHRALHRPALLLTDLETFYRPANTWTLAADHLVWGFRPAGMHLTNLVLHALAGVALLLAARSLGLPLAGALAVAALWVVAPFSEEPAISVAIRFEDLLLLAWLGVIVTWPRPGVGWGRGRIVAVAGFIALALAAKETWVVTPGLVWVLERFGRCAPVRRTWRTAALATVPVLVYVAAYFLAFPGGKSYFRTDPAILAKLPHQLAAFLHLEVLQPSQFPLTWRGGAALALVAAAAVVVIRRRSPAGAVGLALLVLPSLPTLLVPFLPTRYTTIPYAGFLLVAVSAALEAGGTFGPALRRVGAAALAALAVAALVASVATVQRDLEDAGRVSAAHVRLLVEARSVASELPIGRPLVVVRAEAENPLEGVVNAPRGLPKVLYQRSGDAYGLADTAAVLEWALAREDVTFRRLDDDGATLRGVAGTLVVHHAGRFTVDPRPVPDATGEARRLRASGVPACVVRGEILR